MIKPLQGTKMAKRGWGAGFMLMAPLGVILQPQPVVVAHQCTVSEVSIVVAAGGAYHGGMDC